MISSTRTSLHDSAAKMRGCPPAKKVVLLMALAVVGSLLLISWKAIPADGFTGTDPQQHAPEHSNRGLRNRTEAVEFKTITYNVNSSTAELSRVTLTLERPTFRFQQVPNAKVALVHIGKAGGSTLKAMTALVCKADYTVGGIREFRAAKTKEKLCIHHHFREPTLARQIQSYVHMHSYNPSELAKATSFLVTLRNPVDRIISAYRYTHPANCNAETQAARIEIAACRVAHSLQGEKPSLLHPGTVSRQALLRKVYEDCFPSPGVEEFAQSLSGSSMGASSAESSPQCQELARDLVVGGGKDPTLVPHFHYNYQYYASKTIEKFPDKEVLVVRTEQEWEDLQGLDPKAFSKKSHAVTHGSEHYQPSPISTEAYQKLCCVLTGELKVYRDFLERAVNLDASAKQATLEDLQQKCGIRNGWDEWATACQLGETVVQY